MAAWLCLMLAGSAAFAQELKVSGRVSDPAGTPLEGATVVVKETTRGVITDASGAFSILVSGESDVLVVSFAGYATREIPVGSQRSFEVQLTEQLREVEEVVITGYGSQDRGDITGSIVSVKGTEIENLPVAGASLALQGRAAGVQVVRNGGAPGSGGAIRVRGTGTVNNADPLVVIDGVPVGISDGADNPLAHNPLNDINPNDIASIEVLKDASAAAIYGNRGANGVILVTTKRGNYGQPMRLSLNAYAGVSNPVKTIEVLDAANLALLKRERYLNDGDPVNPIWENTAFQTQRTDWQDELLDQGVTQNYDFSISGGGQASTFFFSGGYYGEKGTIKNSFFDRINLRLNSDHRINARLTVGQNLTLIRQSGNFLNTNSAQSGVLWSAIRFHPSLPVIVTEADPIPGHVTGDYGSSSLVPASGGEFGDINNPIFTVDTEDERTTRNRILGNVYAELKLLEGLKFRANFGLDATLSDSYTFEIIVNRQIRTNARNRLTRTYSEGRSLLGEYYLTYDRSFGKHDLSLLAGYSAQQFYSEFFSAQKRDFANEDSLLRYFNNGTNLQNITGDAGEDALASAFTRLYYSYGDRYLLTATFRADGNSKFASGNQWGYFPGVSLGWRISNESFFQNVKAISYLMLTGSWGQLGSDGGVSSLQYLALIRQGARYSFGGRQINGANQSRIPNGDITWETAELADLGLNIGFLDNRLLADLSYFVKTTRNMLLAPPTVGATGTASIPDQNVGEMRNSGFEAEISYRKLAGEFTYSIGANASFIRNEVTKLFDGNFLASRTYGRPNQEISRTFEGQPVATFYGWRTDGLYQTAEEINSDPALANDPRRSNGQVQPGDVKFLDLNGDGLIDEQDREIIGNPHPAATFGLNGDLRYKGFDLNLFFLGVVGADIYNADRMQGIDPTYPFNMYAETINRWNGPNTSNSIPRMTRNRDNLNHRTSDLFIERGDFLRLKNLTLGYTLPRSLTRKAGIERLRVYVSGQNVFTLTGYSGMDPELGYVDGNLQLNVDYAQYPQARTYTAGISLGF